MLQILYFLALHFRSTFNTLLSQLPKIIVLVLEWTSTQPGLFRLYPAWICINIERNRESKHSRIQRTLLLKIFLFLSKLPIILPIYSAYYFVHFNILINLDLHLIFSNDFITKLINHLILLFLHLAKCPLKQLVVLIENISKIYT